MIVTRLRAGTLTVKDYRQAFAKFVEQREAVYKEIDARVCETLNQRWGLKWPEGAVLERHALTRATFIGLLYDYLLIRINSGSHASFGNDVADFVTDAFAEIVNATNARDLAGYAELVNGIPRRIEWHVQNEPCAAADATELQRRAETARQSRDRPPQPAHRKFSLKR